MTRRRPSAPPTPSQTVGPYYAIGLDRRPENELDPDGIELTGLLLDGQEQPIPDGMIEVWDAAGRRWGRSGTAPEGRFRFRLPSDVACLEAFVFARGLLRHQRTRIYLGELPDSDDDVLRALDPADRQTLLAHREGEALRFDIRMQGERRTVFFAH